MHIALSPWRELPKMTKTLIFRQALRQSGVKTYNYLMEWNNCLQKKWWSWTSENNVLFLFYMLFWLKECTDQYYFGKVWDGWKISVCHFEMKFDGVEHKADTVYSIQRIDSWHDCIAWLCKTTLYIYKKTPLDMIH